MNVRAANCKGEEDFPNVDQLPRDTIAQVYMGLKGGEDFIGVSRKRIDWILENIKGKRVLDVGCSEGILPILIARRKIKALGVDVNPGAISYAKNLLSKEDFETQLYADFIVSDFRDLEIEKEHYDSLVVTEVIEHIKDPRELLKSSVKYLRNGGRLILTTPFGYWPHDDHWQNVVLTELKDWLTGLVDIEHLDIVDGYIRLIGLKNSNKNEAEKFDVAKLLEITERGLIAVQKDLRVRIASSQSRPKKKKSKARMLNLSRKLRRRYEKSIDVLLISLFRYLSVPGVSYEAFHAEFDKFDRLERRDLVKACTSLVGGWLSPVLTEKARKRMMRRKRKYEIALSISIRRKRKVPLFPSVYKSKQKVDRAPLDVACILDEFSFECFEPQCRLHQLTKDGWKDILDNVNPSFVLLESAWSGYKGQWRKAMREFGISEDGSILRELLEYCKHRNIKVAFWNKEDPPNFDQFIDVACLCDYVFTTDEGCVDRYLEICPHDRVYVLPFAAQPHIHNPVRAKFQPDRNICFAGSWYAEKHIERQSSLPILLDAAIPFGLEIYDRNFGNASEAFLFPDKYQEYVSGKLEYEDMLSAYKSYKVFLNVDSVQQSKTMFSRRVFELLASSTAVVSSQSLGVKEFFGDIVPQPDTSEGAATLLHDLVSDPIKAKRLGHMGYRSVMHGHTYAHRFSFLCRKLAVDIGEEPLQRQHYVLWVFFVRCGDDVERIQSSVKPQCGAEVRVLLVVEAASVGGDLLSKSQQYQLEVLTVENVTDIKTDLQGYVMGKEFEFVLFGDVRKKYFDNYVADMLLPFSYTDTVAVHKRSYFVSVPKENRLYIHDHHKIHQFCDDVRYVDVVIRSSELSQVDVMKSNGCFNILLENTEEATSVYSPDPFNCILALEQYTEDFDSLFIVAVDPEWTEEKVVNC